MHLEKIAMNEKNKTTALNTPLSLITESKLDRSERK